MKPKLKSFTFILIFLMNIITMNAYANPILACPAFPFFEPKNGVLAVVNCDFHHAYESRVQQIIATFGQPGGRPVLLQLGGMMFFKFNGKTASQTILPKQYHEVKTFGHAAFATYLILIQTQPGKLTRATKNKLKELQNDLQQATNKISTLDLSEHDKFMIETFAVLTQNFLTTTLKKNAWSLQTLQHYFQAAYPFIQQSITIAANAELNALDITINRWLKQLSKSEKKRLGIVVAVSHQARAREISLQYFSKKFGYQFAEGALKENNLVVVEGKFDQASALSALARHYLDQEAAAMMLNDAERLQYDLLGNAAHKQLTNVQ